MHQESTFSIKARNLYHYLAKERIIGLVPDMGFDRDGQTTREINLPNGKSIRLHPENYSAFIVYSILTKLINGSVLYLGDPGIGKTSMAMMIGMIAGRSYHEIKKEVIHGQPQLTLSDLFGPLDLPKLQEGKTNTILHPRIANPEADIIIDEINRIPSKTQSAVLSMLSEKYVELFGGQVIDMGDRTFFATMNDKNGGGTYELIDALKDRFDIAVMAYPRNHIYSGITTPDNTLEFPEKYRFKSNELSIIRQQINELQFSKDAQQRLSFFISIINPAENAAFNVEHAYKANVSGAAIRSSAIFNINGHDDLKKYLGALIEGTISERFLRSVQHYAKALAWFRGKHQVDTEDVEAVVIPASMHRFIPSPHFEKLDLMYKYDAWERSRYLWQQAKEKFDVRFPDKPETWSLRQHVAEFFEDIDYDNAEGYSDYWTLHAAVETLTSVNQKLATIYRSMETFVNNNLDGSEGLEELLAMKLLFFEIYEQSNDNSLKTTSNEKTIGSIVPETIKFLTMTKPNQVNASFIDAVGMKYKPIPAGNRIVLGAAGTKFNPSHTVELRSAYYMSESPITQGMFKKVMGKNPSYFVPKLQKLMNAGITDTQHHPVENVTWYEAVLYTQKLSLMDETIASAVKNKIRSMSEENYENYVCDNPRKGLFRLPTNAEAEHAFRGGTTSPFFWGYDFSEVNRYGWKTPMADRQTYPVKQKLPNPFNLYDVVGNVSSWTHDQYAPDYIQADKHYINPFGPHLSIKNKTRVIRGSSFFSQTENNIQLAMCRNMEPYTRVNDVGFFIVKT